MTNKPDVHLKSNSNFNSEGEFLSAANRIVKMLMHADNAQSALENSTKIAGELLLVDSIFIFQSTKDNRQFRKIFEWLLSDKKNILSEEVIGQELYELIGEEGSVEVNTVYLEDLESEELRLFFDRHNVQSLMVAPVYEKNFIRGAVMFCDTSIQRIWSSSELAFVQTLSLNLSKHLFGLSLQHELENKEKQLEIAIESSNDGFWYINLQSNTMFLSKQWKRMLGYEEYELVNSFETFESLLHPEDRDFVLSTLDPYSSLERGTFECEYRIKNKKDSYQWVLTQAYVKKDKTGVPLRFIGTNIDITARVNYQRSLKEKDLEYRSLVNSVHEIIFKTDQNGVFTFLNPAWEKVTSFSVEKSIGIEALEYIHPDDHFWLKKYLLQRTQTNGNENKTHEVRFLHQKGTFVWIEIFATLLFDKEGAFIGAFGTLIDIHQRKMAELAQRESEQRFKVMSENMSDLVSLISNQGLFTYISPSASELIGYEPNEMLNKEPIGFIHEKDQEWVNTNMYHAIVKQETTKVKGEFRILLKDGSYKWFESILQPIKKGKQVDSLLAVSRDISERKQVEEEMQKALQKEKELNELKSRFVSMASHEFRTPLTSIKSSVELMEMYNEEVDSKLTIPFSKHLGKITNQIDRLTQLMNDILIVGRTEAKKLPFQPEKVDVMEICLHHIDQHYLNRKDGRTVRFKVSGSKKNVLVDPTLFEHILSNALSNALKYSKGKPDPELEIIYEEELFTIVVKDYGIGIPVEEQDKLFTSFFRAENAELIEGTGLGLVILKQFADMHHAKIELKSQEGIGTTIAIKFPI